MNRTPSVPSSRRSTILPALLAGGIVSLGLLTAIAAGEPESSSVRKLPAADLDADLGDQTGHLEAEVRLLPGL